MLNQQQAVVVTEQLSAIKTRAANVRKVPESERWDAERVPFDIQVGRERPAEMVPRSQGDVLTENKTARADFDLWGLSEGCSGGGYLRMDKDDSKLTAKHVGREMKP